jgi:hypothetical protein
MVIKFHAPVRRFGGSASRQGEPAGMGVIPGYTTAVISEKPAPVESPGQAISCPSLRSDFGDSVSFRPRLPNHCDASFRPWLLCVRIQDPSCERRLEPDVIGTNLNINRGSTSTGRKTGLQHEVAWTFKRLDFNIRVCGGQGPVTEFRCDSLCPGGREPDLPLPRRANNLS